MMLLLTATTARVAATAEEDEDDEDAFDASTANEDHRAESMEESGQSSGAHSTVKVVENPPGSAVVPATPAVDTPPVVPATPAVTTTPVVDPEVPVTPPVEGLTPVPPRPTDEPLLSSTDTSKSKPAFVVNPPEGKTAELLAKREKLMKQLAELKAKKERAMTEGKNKPEGSSESGGCGLPFGTDSLETCPTNIMEAEENKDAVPVSREEQLAATATQEDGRGRGRGKGRGRGRGRGVKKDLKVEDPKPKQNAKPRAKKETKSEQSKDAKREVVESSRRSKRKNVDHDWDAWDEVAGKWDEHWEEEWGEHWGWNGWNDQDKMWDKAAWQDGKSSLHQLRTKKGKGQEVEASAPAPAKRIKGKQTIEPGTTETPETKPATKAKPAPKKKKLAKQGEDDPAKDKPAAKAKAKSAPKHVENHRMGRESKILSDCQQVLVEFGKKYKAMGDDYENAKDALKELKALQTEECVFNCPARGCDTGFGG
eukprot:symbB.v1.2.000276.t1/scaffold23.1/size449444/3